MIPKYKMIYDELKDAIQEGEYGPGAKLPDEITLCQIYACSRMTVKKALDILVEEGMIYRKQGQGSFVLNKPIDSVPYEYNEFPIGGFDRSRHDEVSSKLIEFKLDFASKKVAHALHLKENEPVYEIVRLRLYDNEPYVIEHTYMPVNLIPGINEEVLNHSIYAYIEHDLNMRIASARQTTRADVSNALEHEVLGLKDIEPVLEVEQIAYLDNGVPFEYSFSRHRYDKFKFTSFSLRR